MLRTHTTAAIPALLAETESDRLIVCPGLVYRRDVVDRLHVGEPHQADFWIARRARLRRADLLKMIAVVVETVLPGRAYRCNETIHPYTMNGLEVEVQIGDRWVEVARMRGDPPVASERQRLAKPAMVRAGHGHRP